MRACPVLPKSVVRASKGIDARSMGIDIASDTLIATRSAHAVEHDANLLVAALEDIEARRAAIEWLVDANLLCRCLVYWPGPSNVSDLIPRPDRRLTTEQVPCFAQAVAGKEGVCRNVCEGHARS